MVQETGDLLHVPADVHAAAAAAVGQAAEAFEAMRGVSQDQVSAFFEAFAARLESDESWAPIAAANAEDVARAKARGRSTTRLVATRQDARGHDRGPARAGATPRRPATGSSRRVDHDGWRVEQVTAPLGVVAFVFEGRPNVFADAAGVLRGGNTVVFRIGSDALGTARAIAEHALQPALYAAGLPPRAAVLLERRGALGRLGVVLRRPAGAGGGARIGRRRWPNSARWRGRPACRCRCTAPAAPG